MGIFLVFRQEFFKIVFSFEFEVLSYIWGIGGSGSTNQKSKCKMQNYNVKIKNSRISRGTCGHGVFDKYRMYSTNRPFFAKQSQISHQKSEYRRQNSEGKNVYKCLSNKEIRSANFLDVSQDVIKNQHKNKAKTNPIRLRLWLRRDRFFSPGQCPGSTVAVFPWAGSPCHIRSGRAKANFLVHI